MSIKKVVLLVIFLSLIALFFVLDLQQIFNLEYFQAQRDVILAYKTENFWLSSLIYFLLYIIVAALSLPAAAILTIAGGAVFGLAWGLLMVSFASTIGATLAFLLSRTLLRDWVQTRFGRYLKPINEGIERDGAFYLFTLRLIPVFPFFLVNALMALTPYQHPVFLCGESVGHAVWYCAVCECRRRVGNGHQFAGYFQYRRYQGRGGAGHLPLAGKTVAQNTQESQSTGTLEKG